MNAVLAFIADGGRAIIVIDREGVEINYFLHYVIDSTKSLRQRPRPTPSRLPGVRYACPSKPCRWRGKRLHYGGDVVALCLAIQKPSEQEFFVPPETDLGVNRNTAMGAYMRPP